MTGLKWAVSSHSVSSFLFAAENVALQHQNVRRDLKKDEESRAVEMFLLQLDNYIFIFGIIATLLSLDSVVSWLLMML